jgi:FlaA1/EpsC-like NDP-sugar epimerase
MQKPLNNLAIPILDLPRSIKRSVALIVDITLCILAVWLAFYLRLGEFVSLTGNNIWPCILSVSIAIPIFITSGLYRAIFRYSGWQSLLITARAILVYGLLYASIFTAFGIPEVPRTIGIIQPILLLLFISSSRILARLWLGDRYNSILKFAARPKVLIYGAGRTGRQLAAAMVNNHEMHVIGFLDDDSSLHSHLLNGLPIYNPALLINLVAGKAVSDVLLAMPNVSRKRRNEILANIRTSHVAVRTLPSVTALAQGKVSVSDLCDLDIDDLLGRDTVAPDPLLLAKNIVDKVVLVTGAGGSIGSELCRQILAIAPCRLLLIEQSEFALYKIHQELELRFPETRTELIPILTSVRNKERLCEIMSTWRPDTVYHAAAYKHVPLVEHNPAEGILNNVFGTLCLAKVALEMQVSDFVLISTDKAVRPTNIMGASKRLAEMLLQALASTTQKTTFTMVRFGNVLGSSGSVVPKFRQQIRDGSSITLTHSEITRYFMTIPEAAQLVIQAGAMANGGDVFVLDMGEPVKIIDLARRMIELSGLSVRDTQNPDGDIAIDIIGLRPGEKLYEELLIGDNPEPTSHPRIMKAHEKFITWDKLEPDLRTFEIALHNNDIFKIRSMLKNFVADYVPNDEIVDWVYLAKKALVH